VTDVPTEPRESPPGAGAEEVLEAEIVIEEAPDGPIVDEPADIEPHALGLELPADPLEAVQVALAEVVTARGEADAYLADLQRLAADFENYRKRTMREQAAHVERASQRVVESLLPVLDSFDAAFTHEAQTPSEEKLLGGVRSTYHQLLDVLKREGLEPIPALGEPFDPEVHEAVSSLANGEGDLVVAAELRTGFRLRGRVLRPSLVTVDHA
jgi:molecular chaperone GrpE